MTNTKDINIAHRMLINSYHTLTQKICAGLQSSFRLSMFSPAEKQRGTSLTRMCHPVKVSCIMQQLDYRGLNSLLLVSTVYSDSINRVNHTSDINILRIF